ncbi:MAG: DNA polymerase I [Clostridiales bacterium]|nr:DNA polymerase I [Clostridiales bacterium]
MEKDSLIIIDSNSLLNRAFYAMTGLVTSRGEPVGAIYGFTVMLIKLIEEYRPKYLAATFDVHAPTFRHKMSDAYKATRKPMPEALGEQIDRMKEFLDLLGVKRFELAGYEADDLIGTMAKRSSAFTYIVTSDRDSLQLVDDKTHVLLTKRGITELDDVSVNDVPSVFGVPADRVVDFKALAGDSSDNILGVPGIGDKSAVDLITEFGSLDGIYNRIDEIKGARRDKLLSGKDSAYLSYKLATIDRDVPIDFDLEECRLHFPFPAAARDIIDKYEFKSLSRRTDIFESTAATPVKHETKTEKITLKSQGELAALVDKADGDVAIRLSQDGLHLAFDASTDYFAPITDDLLSVFTVGSCIDTISPLFKKHVIAHDLKALLHEVAPREIKNADDVALMSYLLEYRLSPVGAAELYSDYSECKKALDEKGMTALYSDIELPLLRVLYDMETIGFTVDRDKLDEIDVQFSKLEAESAARIREIYGKDINLNSPKQLGTALFEDLKIPYPGKPPYSTKAEILQQLAGEYEIVDEILKHRFNSKIKSTFIDGIRKAMRKDCTVHTSFNQMSTATGRLSSTEPNLQNIPTRSDEGRTLRSMFVPRDGNVLVDADYSQIELKLLAHFSGDPKMTEAFNTGADIHRSTAAEVFGVPIDEVTAAMRRDAKAVNFGIVYGISNFGLSRNINISARKADEYIKRYFERFPAVKRYLDGLIELAKSRGYAETAFGRRRAIPELTSARFQLRKFGERVAMNTPLQGTAADIIKIAMVNVQKRLSGMKSKLILQVHDELVVDAAADELEQVKTILKTEMENAVSLSVPLDVDISVGKNWMECK